MSGTLVTIVLVKDEENGVESFAVEASAVGAIENVEWESEEVNGRSLGQIKARALELVAAEGYKAPFSVSWKRVE